MVPQSLAATLQPPLQPIAVGRRLVAEGLGSLLWLAVVIGSGIMGERLAGGNAAIALLGNTLATGAALVVLITIFGPISGAHFNPVVTLVLLITIFGPISGAHFNPVVTLAFALRRQMTPALAAAYVVVQFAGAVL